MSPSVLGEVIVRARDDTQSQKLINALAQLEEHWGDNEVLWPLARVEATCPHLTKMADAERLSLDWTKALSEALSIAADSVEAIEKEHGGLGRVLDDIQKNC